MITYTNTTPHAINVLNDENELIMEIPSSGISIRLDQTESLVTTLSDDNAEVEVLRVKFQANEDLPPIKPLHY